jgi:hypothetical protein
MIVSRLKPRDTNRYQRQSLQAVDRLWRLFVLQASPVHFVGALKKEFVEVKTIDPQRQSLYFSPSPFRQCLTYHRVIFTLQFGSCGPDEFFFTNKRRARVAELADALDLGSSGQPWGFESPLSHQDRLLEGSYRESLLEED